MSPISKSIPNGLRYTSYLYVPIFCLLAGLIHLAQQWSLALPLWVNNYMNDFFCMPIVLFVCQYAVRKLKSHLKFRLSLPLILSVTLYYAIYFEYYLPKINPRYTADPLDVVLYFLGALFFYFTENRVRKAKR